MASYHRKVVPTSLTIVLADTTLATDLFEARAVLLGRLGRHDQALELYVYRLQDFKKAEEYNSIQVTCLSLLTSFAPDTANAYTNQALIQTTYT